MHRRRIWGLGQPEGDAAELARKLSEHSWCLCTGFETAAGTIWVNDATSPDGAQEYGVLRRQGDRYAQVESITISWCERDEIERFIREADEGGFDGDLELGTVDLEQLERDHQPCGLCR